MLISSRDDAGCELDREAQLVERYARLYRSELARLIQKLNASAGQAGGGEALAAESIRHCVEAVDLVLSSHARFARSLRRLALTGDGPTPRRAA